MDALPIPDAGELLATAGGVLLPAILWTLLGAFLGFVGAMLFFLVWRRLGWLGTTRTWVRLSLLLIQMFFLTLVGGAAGYAEGMRRGVEAALRDGPLGRQVLPRVGEVGADLVALVYGVVMPGAAMDREEFMAGRGEINVKALLTRLGDIKEAAILGLAEDVKQKALALHPEWKDGAAEKVLDWALPWLARQLANAAARQEDRPGMRDFLHGLQGAAERQGGRDTLTRAELADFFTSDVILPGLLQPVRSFARHLLLAALVIAAVFEVLPLLLIRIFCRTPVVGPGVT